MHKSQRTENGMEGDKKKKKKTNGVERGIANVGVSRQNKGERSVSCSNVFWVQLGSSLQCVREFIKAFRERGGDLHIAERQHREVVLMPLHQSAHTHKQKKVKLSQINILLLFPP